MSFEIELKAHVPENMTDKVKTFFDKSSFCNCLGEIDKDDVYWGRPEDTKKAIYRTRREKTEEGYRILFTHKPQKHSENGIEHNTELEFEASDQWENCLEFQRALGFVPVRHKFKKGWHYEARLNGFEVHVELLNVRYLGCFLEMEICPENLDGFDENKAVETLKTLVTDSGLNLNSIESRGYNDMLIECGHQLG